MNKSQSRRAVRGTHLKLTKKLMTDASNSVTIVT